MIVNCNQSYAGTRIVTTGSDANHDETDCVVLDEETQALVKVDDETLYLNATNENEVLLSNNETQSSAENLLSTFNTNENSLVNLNSNRMMNLNLDWKFYLGNSDTAQNKNFDDSSWSDITIPHDFSIFQNFTSSGEAESGFLPGGTGWYRKTFVLPEDTDNKSIILDFDGVYSDAYVYVNGTYVGEHHYGYSNFAFDVSDLLICDNSTENVIAVKAVNNIPTSRWYSGSGIYRDVNLIITDKVHVDYNGTTITTPDIASGSGKVQNVVEVINDNNAAVNIVVKSTVFDAERSSVSTTVSQNITINANSKQNVTLVNNVSNPELWSIDNPNLYYVHTEITDTNDNVLDTYDSSFGFRYFNYSSSGMTLNGQKIKLNGVCMHHDQGAAGSAAYYDAMYRQLVIMKNMGVNAIRTSHNPVDRQYIQICDEIGLLVIEEMFDGLVDPKNYNSNDFSKYFETAVGENNNLYNSTSSMHYSEYVTRSIVKRDINSPSVFAWSFGNEIQEGTVGNTAIARYANICASFISWVTDLDTSRIVTSGDNNRGQNSNLVNVINTILNAGGIAGFNYPKDGNQSLSSLASSYGGSHNSIIASETSSAVNSRGMYKSQESASDADGKYHLTSYDTSAVSWGKTAHDSMYEVLQSDNVLGEFIWTGFDYIGEPTPWNGTTSGDGGRGRIPNSSYFGIVDTAGFAKDTYYLYRSQWEQSDTTLHLVTAWDSDNYMLTNGKTPVWVYSNAPIVKLYKDGTHIGTATRRVVKTNAGYEYYTYTTESVDSSVCQAVSTSGADSLYSIFNVSYSDGTISAKAFDENNNEIPVAAGTTSVTTAGESSQLSINANRTELDANDQDLLYVEVDVLDANGNLNTVATNDIVFTVEGEGEIVGVDNGDQATTAKYQQSSVITSKKSAHINAYAGKALVIVKSTDTAGNIQVNVSSNGLTGGSVNARTIQVLEETPSYTYTKNYSTIHGTPVTLDTSIIKLLGNESISGTIAWEDYTQINEVGSHSISGEATFSDGTTKTITCNLHIIDNVVVMKNISTAVCEGTVPVLPNNLKGYVADGSLSTFEFNVQWNTVNETMFANVGDIVEVEGSATILGERKLPVKAFVRVAELVNTQSSNVGTLAHVSQDITGSDNLNSVNNGTINPGDNTNERWSNYENRTSSPYATLTFSWDTAQLIQDINIDYYIAGTSQLPDNVVIKYSLNGSEFTEIGYTATQSNVAYNLGARYNYELEEVINPVAISITFTQKGGQASSSYCVAVTEVEFNTFAGALEYNSSANLSSILVNETALEGFDAETLEYNVSNVTSISATSDDNAAITVLPINEGITRIIAVSEDGTNTKTYSLVHSDVCLHENTTIINQTNATCTSTGYTGDTYCDDCKDTIAQGSVIPVTGHVNTEIINVISPTCEQAGNTGDTFCNDCNQIIGNGTAIDALGHNYSKWVITTQPTYESTGVKTHYCSRCDSSYEEELGMLKKVPTLANLTLGTESDGAHRILVQGQLNDFANLNSYYTIIDHGFIYYSSARLGTRNLTMNTIGKYKTSNIGYGNDENYNPNGTFSTYIDPSFNNLNSDDLTKYDSEYYTIRAYATYEDSYGNIVHVYSNAVKASYNSVLGATQ